jgi:hypothetical protein
MITPADSQKVDSGAITDEQLGNERAITGVPFQEELTLHPPPTANDTTSVLDGPVEDGQRSEDGEAMGNAGASTEDEGTGTHGRGIDDQAQILEPPQEVTQGRRRISATAVRVTPQVVGNGSEGSESEVAGSGSDGGDMGTETYDHSRFQGRGMIAARNHIQDRTTMRVRQYGEDSGLARDLGLDSFGSGYPDDAPAAQSRMGSVEDVVDQQLDVTTALHERHQVMEATVEKLAEKLAETTERLTAMSQEATFFRQRADARAQEQQQATERMQQADFWINTDAVSVFTLGLPGDCTNCNAASKHWIRSSGGWLGTMFINIKDNVNLVTEWLGSFAIMRCSKSK